MNKLQIDKLTNLNVYLDGINFLGRAEEASLPNIVFVMAEHKALGMIGAVDLPQGIDKMETKIKWSSLYPEALKKAANPYKAINFQFRGNLQEFSGQGLVSEKEVVYSLTGFSKGIPLGDFKAQDNCKIETSFTAHYASLTIGGDEIFELDVMNNIYKVDGVDVLEMYRANTGA